MKSLKPLLLVGSLLLSSMAWAEGGSDRVFERIQQMQRDGGFYEPRVPARGGVPCESCPVGASCAGQTESPRAQPGFWIASDHDYVISALGAEGPVRLGRDWRRLGATLQEQGRNFFNAALDELIEISQAH